MFICKNSTIYTNDHPRLQGAVSLHRRGRYMGLHGNLGRNSNVKGAGDPKSEGEKQKLLLSAIVIFSKKREKLGPGAEGV